MAHVGSDGMVVGGFTMKLAAAGAALSRSAR
jgi:hypothetical protein